MKKKSKSKFSLPMIFGEDEPTWVLGLFPMSAIEFNLLGYQFMFIGAIIIIVAAIKLFAMSAG